MRLLGWTDGKNVAIEDRFADYDTARVSANAVAFAAAKVDVIVAFSGVPARAAREATSSIPIVMDAGDPVGQGLVASLARSGSNVTGQSLMRQDMAAKQLQMLREAIPKATRIAVLQQPDYKLHLQQMAEIERTAVMLGVSVLAVSAGVVQDLPHLFEDMKEAGVDAYLVLNEPRTDGSVQRLGVCGGGDMTGRAVSGGGIVDELGVAAGRNARGRRDAQCRADGARPARQPPRHRRLGADAARGQAAPGVRPASRRRRASS